MNASRTSSKLDEETLPTPVHIDLEQELVLGSSRLFKGDQLQYIPMPTPDPKDPLNLPEWRKWLAIAALCFFGSLALSIENIIGHLIPLFFLEYNGIDPKRASDLSALYRQYNNNNNTSSAGNDNSNNLNALDALSSLGHITPLSQVVMLTTLPHMINGVASFLLVPLSTAIGRRPVMLLTGLLAWVGGIWAGQSTSLGSHLVARCFQGFGAGVVEALIPLILQDLMFIHQRNKAIATLHASQGVILISLGIACPYIALRLGWRQLYTIFSCLTALAWIGVIICVPESRVHRSKDELAGKAVYPLQTGEARPRLDAVAYGARTKWTDFGILNTPIVWKKGLGALRDTIKCLVFPTVFWAVLVSATASGATGAVFQSSATVLLASGWSFERLGLAGLSTIAATPLIWLFSGFVADKVSNRIARRRGGHREPEDNLVNIVLPLGLIVVGILVYGYAAANIAQLSSAVVLVGIFILVLGGVCTSTTLQVFLVESYPNYAGPVLVTFSSLRLIIGFGFSVKATVWIKALGFMSMFGVYAGMVAFAALLGIPVWRFGKRIRCWASGTVKTSGEPKRALDKQQM